MKKFTKKFGKALEEVGGTIEDLDEEIEVNDNWVTFLTNKRKIFKRPVLGKMERKVNLSFVIEELEWSRDELKLPKNANNLIFEMITTMGKIICN